MTHRQKKQIHLDCRQFGNSGIGTYIENLILQYQQLESDLDFKLLVRKDLISKSDQFPDFHLKEYNEKIYSLMEQIKWMTRVDPFGFLHVPHYNAPFFYPGKLVITVHDVCHIAMRQFFPGILKRMYSSLFFKRILVRADHIITVSEFSKSEIIKYFKIHPEKISVIYNGVSPLFKPVSQSNSEPVLKHYKLPGEFILYLGNLKLHKNFKGVVESYKEACEADSHLPPLVVIGNDTNLFHEFPDLKKTLAEPELKKRIIFTGSLPTRDLPAIYSRASVFLFPSFYEGFGLTVLEAMACGTPVITSNTSALPEIVDGAAKLVNPHDTSEIAAAILELSSNKDAQNFYIQKGFQHIEHYSWEKSAKDHLDLYSKLLLQEDRSKPVISTTLLSRITQPEKHNILFLDQYGDRIGGGQIILLDVLEKFRANGNWNVFISLPEEGKFTRLLAERGFNYHVIKTWQPAWHQELKLFDYTNYFFSSLKSSYHIGKLIKQHDIKTVYCNGGRTFLNGTFLSTMFSLNLFFHLHLLLEKKQKKAVTILGKAPGVKSIFAVSKLLENQYFEDRVFSKIQVVSNWVSPDMLSTERVQRSLKLTTPVHIGIVGQISKAKGQWRVLEEFLESATILPIKLMIFGDPLEYEPEHWNKNLKMMDELRQKGWQVEYMGFYSNKTEIYDQLDILIIPSLVPESFGLTAIEAMAREVVVIANRSGALVEIIQHPDNGLLYDAMKKGDLVETLTKVIEGRFDYVALKKNGLETVSSKYHPEKQLELLHKIVSNAVLKNNPVHIK